MIILKDCCFSLYHEIWVQLEKLFRDQSWLICLHLPHWGKSFRCGDSDVTDFPVASPRGIVQKRHPVALGGTTDTVSPRSLGTEPKKGTSRRIRSRANAGASQKPCKYTGLRGCYNARFTVFMNGQQEAFLRGDQQFQFVEILPTWLTLTKRHH